VEETDNNIDVEGDLEGNATEHDTDEDSLDDPDLPIKFRQSARMYKERKEKVPSNERKENALKREPTRGEDLSASQIALIDLGEILSRHKCDIRKDFSTTLLTGPSTGAIFSLTFGNPTDNRMSGPERQC
jgi:hypothetical protein